MKKIPLHGSPEEIGFQHGSMLTEQIHLNIDFYKAWFLSNLGDEDIVLKAASSFKDKIQTYNPDFASEIDHIALGADVSDPLWVYALNSRTELVVTQQINECTAIVFPHHHLIGQTWDWAQFLEDKFVVMEINFPSGHKILQLTEAGIIGKIGLNNKGLGQTLNILRFLNSNLDGVPIHIVLRAVLESNTLDNALDAISRSGLGKASNIILAWNGMAMDVEFAWADSYHHEINSDVYIHTNHYLHAPDSVRVADDSYANSLGRFTTAVELGSSVNGYSSQDMISILSDRSNPEHPILSDFTPSSLKGMGDCGTLATVVMDLKNLTMKVRTGNPSSSSHSFQEFAEFHISS